MLPLILPPLIVLVALGGLLYIFFRKLPEVEEKIRSDELRPSVFAGDRVRRFSLGLVERFARLFKMLSLRLHNRLNLLASKAREARERAAERIALRKGATPSPPFLSRRDAVPSSSATETSHIEVAQPLTESRESSEMDQSAHSQPEDFLRIESRGEGDLAPMSADNRESVGKLPPNASTSPDAEARVSSPVPNRGFRGRSVRARQVVSDAVRRLRPARATRVAPSEAEAPLELPVKKDQLEGILIERISMNPRDIEAYERLGDYYLEQDNLTDAKECYRQVLKLSPAYRLVKIKIRRLERLLEKR